MSKISQLANLLVEYWSMGTVSHSYTENTAIAELAELVCGYFTFEKAEQLRKDPHSHRKEIQAKLEELLIEDPHARAIERSISTDHIDGHSNSITITGNNNEVVNAGRDIRIEIQRNCSDKSVNDRKDESKREQKEYLLLESIKSKAAVLLSQPKHCNFTDHQITHSERVIDIVHHILEEDSKLSVDEWFVLTAAAYLHDIGMQIRREDLLQYPDLDKLLSESKLTRDDLVSETKLLSFIRDWHHIFSFYMITNILRKHLGLSDYRYVVEIALVAQGHRKVDLLSEEYKKRSNIRVDLLSALVRLADEFDCDKTRVDLDQLLVQELNLDQKIYWFFHFCVDKLEINNHYLKIYARVPKDLSAKFRSSFIIPIYKKYLEILEIFEKEGIVLAWALSDINESEDMTRVFQKEEGLLEHIEEKSRDIKDLFKLEEHLDEEESLLDYEVTPFYSTGIERFDGIRIKNWSESTHYCQYIIFMDPEEIKDDLTPEKSYWKSEIVEIDKTSLKWPKLLCGKEYGFIIYLFGKDDHTFPLQTLKGKFQILESEKIESARRLMRTIEKTNLDLEDKQIIQIGFEIRIGNYEKAILVMHSLLKQNISAQIEILDKLNSVYEEIIFEMKRMGWVNQANTIDRIRNSMILKFCKDIHKPMESMIKPTSEINLKREKSLSRKQEEKILYEKKSFWSTLPGIIAAISGIIAAIAALITALYTVGILGDSHATRDELPQQRIETQLTTETIMLQIKIPRQGDKVGLSEIVSGVTTIRDRNLYLVVIPMLTGDKYIVDGPLHMDLTGAWSGRARFGEGKKGIGERFVVSIIATDLILNERVLDNLPPNSQIFNSIEVERVK